MSMTSPHAHPANLVMSVSFGCFHGPISRFDSLRIAWARDGGYDIIPGIDYGGGYVQPDMPNLPWDSYVGPDDYLGEWPSGAPDDPLVIVLIHEEKQGRIQSGHVPLVADRLASLPISYNAQHFLATQTFIQGLRYAQGQHLDVLFT